MYEPPNGQKVHGSGLLFNHLQFTFQRDGVQGVYVLCVDINNKPPVTKN